MTAAGAMAWPSELSPSVSRDTDLEDNVDPNNFGKATPFGGEALGERAAKCERGSVEESRSCIHGLQRQCTRMERKVEHLMRGLHDLRALLLPGSMHWAFFCSIGPKEDNTRLRMRIAPSMRVRGAAAGASAVVLACIHLLPSVLNCATGGKHWAPRGV